MNKNFDYYLRTLLSELAPNPPRSVPVGTGASDAIATSPSTSAEVISLPVLSHFTVEQLLLAAADFGQDRYGFVAATGLRELTRYFKGDPYRSIFRQASFLTARSRLCARVIEYLQGVRVPVCSGQMLRNRLLANIADFSDRIVVVGAAADQATALSPEHDLVDVRYVSRATVDHDEPAVMRAYLESVEQASPFRFCFLCLGSPHDELIAYSLALRGTATGLAICIGDDAAQGAI